MFEHKTLLVVLYKMFRDRQEFNYKYSNGEQRMFQRNVTVIVLINIVVTIAWIVILVVE